MELLTFVRVQQWTVNYQRSFPRSYKGCIANKPFELPKQHLQLDTADIYFQIKYYNKMQENVSCVKTSLQFTIIAVSTVHMALNIKVTVHKKIKILS